MATWSFILYGQGTLLRILFWDLIIYNKINFFFLDKIFISQQPLLIESSSTILCSLCGKKEAKSIESLSQCGTCFH